MARSSTSARGGCGRTARLGRVRAGLTTSGTGAVQRPLEDSSGSCRRRPSWVLTTGVHRSADGPGAGCGCAWSVAEAVSRYRDERIWPQLIVSASPGDRVSPRAPATIEGWLADYAGFIAQHPDFDFVGETPLGADRSRGRTCATPVAAIFIKVPFGSSLVACLGHIGDTAPRPRAWLLEGFQARSRRRSPYPRVGLGSCATSLPGTCPADPSPARRRVYKHFGLPRWGGTAARQWLET